MRLTPKDIDKCKCYYCGGTRDEKDLVATEKRYKEEKIGDDLSIYYQVDLEFPTCSACEHERKQFLWAPMTIGVVMVVFLLYSTLLGSLNLRSFLGCSVAIIIAFVAIIIVSLSARMMLFKQVDTEEHQIINILKEYGWTLSSLPEKEEATFTSEKDFDPGMLEKILRECGYVLKESD